MWAGDDDVPGTVCMCRAVARTANVIEAKVLGLEWERDIWTPS